MTEFIRSIFYMIYCLSPRHDHAVVYGWPDGEDNSMALLEGLQRSHLKWIILLVSGDAEIWRSQIGPRTRVVRKNSLYGLLWFVTARYVFFTHRCFMHRFPADVISVNVWHGMPIKRIGKLLPGSDVICSSHILATSPFWAKIMKNSMCNEAVVLNTGLPRNDRLFADKSSVRHKLGINAYTKCIVWLPTYRISSHGQFRIDGHRFNSVFPLYDFIEEEFNQYLASINAILLIKPHPMSSLIDHQKWSNIEIIDETWLIQKDISLYTLLAASDMLISDVSSVIIDYLLLDRPIVHAFPDLIEYQDNRGFSLQPIKEFLCGAIVSNHAELTHAIDRIHNGFDEFQSRRANMLAVSHANHDNKSTHRLLQSIGLV